MANMKLKPGPGARDRRRAAYAVTVGKKLAFDRLNHQAWLIGYMLLRIAGGRIAVIKKPNLHVMLEDNVDAQKAVLGAPRLYSSDSLNDVRRWLADAEDRKAEARGGLKR
jgi:hypothetical protein